MSRLSGFLLLSFLAALPLGAEDAASPWVADFDRALSAASNELPSSPLALGLARRLGLDEFASLPPEEAAQLALHLALAADADLRAGRNYQETRARSVQQARLLLRDIASGLGQGPGSALARLKAVRRRAGWVAGRGGAGRLADPLGRDSASGMQGWIGPHKR